MNSSNEARFERIGAVLMLECPMECYAVCTGKCVSMSPTHRGTSKRWGRYQSIRRNFLGAFAIFRKLLLHSLCPSVRPNATTRLPLKVFLQNLIFEHFSKKKKIWKFKIHWTLTRITRTLHEDRQAFFITPRSDFLRMRNISFKTVEKFRTQCCVPWLYYSRIVPFRRSSGNIL